MKEDVIEVRPEIMQLLESFGASLLKSSTNKASAGRSLALLKKNSKKLILKKPKKQQKITVNLIKLRKNWQTKKNLPNLNLSKAISQEKTSLTLILRLSELILQLLKFLFGLTLRKNRLFSPFKTGLIWVNLD